jgi:DNA-binding CsgD family transcriptional regulator
VYSVHLPGDLPAWRRVAGLTGRHAECGVLDQLVEDVRAGDSRALVVHGEAGAGKTALLEYLAGHAPGCRAARAAGVQSEMELPFASLHQLCAPILDHLENLPGPQCDALRTAFGISSGPAPDGFLIGLAVLGLLSHAAEERPLVCLVDDAQWLDHASARVLAFAARRLGTESVGLVFAARVPGGDLPTLPQLEVQGLSEADAHALLDSVLPGLIDRRVQDQIVAEARGNPLAMLELIRGLTMADLAGGFGLAGAVQLAGSVEESFRRRLAELPPQTRRLLLVAAADPTGDPALVWRAACRLGIGPGAAAAAADAGLAEFGTRIRFHHPLARSAAYQSALTLDRQEAHRALAEVTDQQLDPDRRAWHRAQAAPGPDDEVAAELERSAGRARARGGLTAAAAFLKQAATLTLDPALRAGRALAAAQAKIQAGAFDVARDLLAMAESGPLSDRQQANVDVLRAQLALVTSRGGDAPALLARAAGRLKLTDPGLSRATYLDALSAAIFAGRLAGPGSGVLEVARVAGAAPPAPTPHAADLLLDGLIAHFNEGYAAGLPMFREALAVFGDGMSAEEELHWLWPAIALAASRTWDYDRWDALSARHVQLARDTGALSELHLALTARAYALLFAGELAAAALVAEEIQVVKEATGSGLASYAAFGLAALRGEEAKALALIGATMQDATRRGEGQGITFADWAKAVLCNGLGQYDSAAAAAQRACKFDDDPGSLIWVMPELAEAASHVGMTDAAVWACDRLAEATSASSTDWSLGIQARTSALVSNGEDAEHQYREAIARLGETRLRVDLARSHLLYGEWLRRERRRTEARDQLRTAHRMLEAMGMEAFAERARRELRATGETARRRALVTNEELTAQEALIASLARDGLSNPEISTRLFISAHTVQYHLRKVFAKLGINSRSQLDHVLQGSGVITSP